MVRFSEEIFNGKLNFMCSDPCLTVLTKAHYIRAYFMLLNESQLVILTEIVKIH